MKNIIKNFKNIKYGPAPEDDKDVLKWIKNLSSPNRIYINGKWTLSKSSKTLQAINPSTNSKLFKLVVSSKKDVDSAVIAANKAYPKWSKLSSYKRSQYLYALARLIQKHARFLSVLESIDNGKPIRETRDIDIPLVARHFYYHAGWAAKSKDSVKSLGVVGQIIPWNFPLLMLAWKIAPAIACGNTVVLKPAETTPLTALKLAEIIQDADLPPGVVNIVTGDGSTGEYLVNHSKVDKIAFTGSTEVGKSIIRALAGSSKKYTLELGGKAANIIFEDAPIDQAVEGIINSIFFNQGHVCCAGSRLYVQESVSKEIISKLKSRMENLILGDPLDKNTDIGAINSKTQLEKIQMYLDIGVDEGSTIYQSTCTIPKKGYWCAPTLFTDMSQSHRLVQEEIFGPVLVIQTFRTIDEVIAKANNTPYGLSGGVWTVHKGYYSL
jgi:aldehyde dehydrogenase (NAD+)